MRDWSAQAIRRAIAAGEPAISKLDGASMHPLLRNGMHVRLGPVRNRDLRVGAVVAIPVGDALAIHRVVQVDGDLIVTKGDAAENADAPIRRASVVALVTAFEVRAGVWLPMWSQRLAARFLRLIKVQR